LHDYWARFINEPTETRPIFIFDWDLRMSKGIVNAENPTASPEPEEIMEIVANCENSQQQEPCKLRGAGYIPMDDVSPQKKRYHIEAVINQRLGLWALGEVRFVDGEES
jgi:hypothetical protein